MPAFGVFLLMFSWCAKGDLEGLGWPFQGIARALFVRAMLHLLNKTCENYDFIVYYFNLGHQKN
jgi:hypothetical protein